MVKTHNIKTTKIYPDKCIEIYINNNIITDNCTNGRLIMELQQYNKEIKKQKMHNTLRLMLNNTK